MYQTHFHLNDHPFASAPHPEHYFPAATIEQARESIAMSVERASGVSLLMGPVGTGKTLLCQLIANEFAHELPVCMLPGERLRDRTMLLQAILHRLDLPYRDQSEGELRLLLSNHVTGNSCPKGILLVVDEADRLPLELLEELRVITNLVHEGRPAVRLVLAGGPRLEERVGHPKLESLNQRVIGRHHLSNFTKEETSDYITARVAACGGDAQGIFSQAALDTVFRATAGVPRLVNQLCDHALLLSSVGEVDHLDKPAIEEAWADLQQLPLPSRGFRGERTASSSQDTVVEYGPLDEEDSNAALCAQLDELHDVVASANSDTETGTEFLQITGDIEFEHSLNVDMEGDFEFEHDVVIASDLPEPRRFEITTSLDNAERIEPLDPPTMAWAERCVEDPIVHEREAAEEKHVTNTPTPDVLRSAFTDLAEDEIESRDEDAPTVWAEESADAWNNDGPDVWEEVHDTQRGINEHDVTSAHPRNPFTEPFEEEEVIIQRFSSPSVLARQDHNFVTSPYSRRLASRLTAAHPGLRMVTEDDPKDSQQAGHHEKALHQDAYRPLSACIAGTMPPQESLSEDEREGVLVTQQQAGGTTSAPYDPSTDPVMPESALEGLSKIVTIEADELSVELSPSASPTPPDTRPFVDREAASQEESQALSVSSGGTSAASGTPDLIKKRRVFRSLFSSMRRG